MTYREIPEIKARYKSKEWKQLRKQKLSLNPMCERCLLKGIYISAYFVHHKEYITDKNYYDDNIFLNIDNLESLCKSCHNKEHFGDEVDYIFDSEGNLIKA